MNAHVLDAEKVAAIKWAGEGMNTPQDVLLVQVRENIARGLPQVCQYPPNPHTAILVCGGPSLNLPEMEKEIVRAQWLGGKVVAVNGAYQWCIDRNIMPAMAIMLDAREFNARFIDTPIERCRYLLASQCHPKVFEICRDRDVTIWHACSCGDPELDMLCGYYFQERDAEGRLSGRQNIYPISLGVTVGIRAISLLRMLGFTSIDIFGLDSCWLGDEHHGYAQPENGDKRIGVWLRPQGRDDKAVRFECAPWHMKQAQDFMALIRERGNLFQLNVRGPGLLATILKTGAEIQMEKAA